MEFKKTEQSINITKQKHTSRYREQSNSYQWGKERGEEQDKERGLRDINHYALNKKEIRIYFISQENIAIILQ